MKGIDERGKPHVVLLEEDGGDQGGDGDGAPIEIVGNAANPVPVCSPAARPMRVEQAGEPLRGFFEEEGITDTTHYPVIISMKDPKGGIFNHVAFQLILDCAAGTVTATVEATMNEEDPLSENDWVDVTSAFGVASLIAAATEVTDFWVDDAGLFAAYTWFRIKIVAATGAASGDYQVFCIRWKE